MNVVDIQRSSALRSFIETTLGFGRPFDNKNQPSLFQKKDNSFYYAANNSLYQASMNVIDLAEWEKIHVNEAGVQLHDIGVNMLGRIEAFIDKQLAKQGFRLVETTKNKRSESYLKIVSDTFNLFADNYRKGVDPYAVIRSSVSLRPVPDTLGHDMVLRLFVSSSFESGFVSIVIRDAVKEVALNISDEQKKAVVTAVQLHLGSYGEHGQLFRASDNFDITHYILNQVLSRQQFAQGELQTLWSNYRAVVVANAVLVEGGINQLQHEFYPVYKLVERTKGIAPGSKEEIILVNTFAIANQLVNNYVAFNSQFA